MSISPLVIHAMKGEWGFLFMAINIPCPGYANAEGRCDHTRAMLGIVKTAVWNISILWMEFEI